MMYDIVVKVVSPATTSRLGVVPLRCNPKNRFNQFKAGSVQTFQETAKVSRGEG
jgi:hypothetical protein